MLFQAHHHHHLCVQNFVHFKQENTKSFDTILMNERINAHRNAIEILWWDFFPFSISSFCSRSQLFTSYPTWFSACENADGSQFAKFIFILCLFKVLCAPLEMCVFFSTFCVRLFFCGQLLNISHPQLLRIGKSKRKKKKRRETEQNRNRNDHIVQICIQIGKRSIGSYACSGDYHTRIPTCNDSVCILGTFKNISNQLLRRATDKIARASESNRATHIGDYLQKKKKLTKNNNTHENETTEIFVASLQIV